jgi:hypothetical protein
MEALVPRSSGGSWRWLRANITRVSCAQRIGASRNCEQPGLIGCWGRCDQPEWGRRQRKRPIQSRNQKVPTVNDAKRRNSFRCPFPWIPSVFSLQWYAGHQIHWEGPGIRQAAHRGLRSPEARRSLASIAEEHGAPMNHHHCQLSLSGCGMRASTPDPSREGPALHGFPVDQTQQPEGTPKGEDQRAGARRPPDVYQLPCTGYVARVSRGSYNPTTDWHPAGGRASRS